MILSSPLPPFWPPALVQEFCRRWKIVELSLFGSALRDDFRPDSDMDLLVRYAPGAAWTFALGPKEGAWEVLHFSPLKVDGRPEPRV